MYQTIDNNVVVWYITNCPKGKMGYILYQKYFFLKKQKKIKKTVDNI